MQKQPLMSSICQRFNVSSVYCCELTIKKNGKVKYLTVCKSEMNINGLTYVVLKVQDFWSTKKSLSICESNDKFIKFLHNFKKFECVEFKDVALNQNKQKK